MVSATSDGALVLRNVTIVDVERGRLEPRRDVVIVGDRIVGIEAGGTVRAPKQGRVLDGNGRFLMPGLWDFHVHVFSAPDEEDFALPLYILNGITGVRDAGALRTLPEQQRVSDDNAYAESLFRTAKYRPEFPAKGFADLEAARAWAAEFVRWYNDEHRHSGIRYVTPGQRHCGADHAILAARHALYLQARERNPARWSGPTRDWSPIGAVTLNPERDSVVEAHSKAELRQPLAA